MGIVPQVQRDASACGPACLAMVLEYYGMPVDLTMLRRAAATGKAGSDLKTLRDLARDAGFEARGFRLSLTELANLSGPSIVHYDAAHFLIVERIDNRGVHVVDPAYGRGILTVNHFLGKWNGVTLVIEDPTSRETRARRKKSHELRPPWVSSASTFHSESVRAVYKAASRKLGGTVAKIFFSAILLQVLGLAFPLLAAKIIDQAIGAANRGLLVAFVAGLVTAAVAQLAISAARDVLLFRIKIKWEERFFQSLFRHVIRFPLESFDRYKREDLVGRFQTTSAIRQLFSAGFVQGALDVSLIVGYIAVVFKYSLEAGLVCVFVALLLCTSARYFAPSIKAGVDQSYQATVRASGSVMETIMSAETVKLLGLEDARAAHWLERFAYALRIEGANEARGLTFRTSLNAITTLGQAAIYGIAGTQVISGQLSIGGFAALTAIYVMATSRVQTLSTLWIDASTVGVALTRVNGLLEEKAESLDAADSVTPIAVSGADATMTPPQSDSPGLTRSNTFRLRGPLSFQRVGFRYRPDDDLPALSDVSLTIKEGERVAIVGRNGSGKSTLLKLVTFLYADYEGEISWAGREARSLPLRAARSRIGCIPQTVQIFEGTVEENLLISCPTAGVAQLHNALRLSGLLTEIGAPKSVLGLPLLSNGSNLSGGQRLKLAFARLFLTDPDVIVLDEASSALDASSEQAIMRSVFDAFSGRTILTAAHRLSTVMGSDKILVMSGGRIVEQGTHASLRTGEGPYAELLRAYVGS